MNTQTSRKEYGRIHRRRKPTHDEATWLATTYGYRALTRYHLAVLTQDECVAFRREWQLERLQSWERLTFGRVITLEWKPICALDPKHLTT